MKHEIFEPTAKITISAHSYDGPTFYSKLQPVIGYVDNDLSSHVFGYIIKKHFYGTIRVYDKRSQYHVVFYVEPISNLNLYKKDAVIKKSVTENAFLFEYVNHDELVQGKSADETNTKEESTATQNPSVITGASTRPSVFNKYSTLEPCNISSTDCSNISTPAYDPGSHNYSTLEPSLNLTTPKTKTRKAGIRKRAIDSDAPEEEEYLVDDDVDVIQEFKLQPDSGEEADEFEESNEVHLCSLCAWIQPNFAHKFGLGAGMEYGVSEIISNIQLMNWIFLGFDFNKDGLPDQIGFVIREIVVTDEISAESSTAQPGKGFSDHISRLTPQSAVVSVSKHFKQRFKGCCVSLGFIYHNIAPAFAATNLRGLCTEKSVGLVSGYLHSHKVAKFDVYRGTMHVMGHLFGSENDVITRKRCLDSALSTFINPFIMHPVQMLNVGFRPNSFRVSDCSRLQISQFLSTLRPGCLQKLQSQPFCGNGLIEPGEDCDCGSPFECHTKMKCCGERDSLLACKTINTFKGSCFFKKTALLK